MTEGTHLAEPDQPAPAQPVNPVASGRLPADTRTLNTANGREDSEKSPRACRRRHARGLGIQFKFLIMLLSTSILAVATIGALGDQLGTQAIRQDIFDRLTGVRAEHARHTEQYFSGLKSQIITYSEAAPMVAAMREFTTGFEELQGATITPAQDEAIAGYYRTSFLPHLQQNVEGKPAVDGYLPSATAQRYLQYYYTITSENDDQKSQVDDAGDGSAWSAANSKYQPLFRSIAQRFQFDDILLIDSATGDVVYTARKSADLGTNLETGVYADSSLGRAFRVTRRSGDPQFVYFADYERYRAAYNAPVGFLLSPLFDGSRQLGVLALRFSRTSIDDHLTGARGWAEEGLGQTGECILVGPDHLMRTNSRALLEDPKLYRSQAVAAGMSPDQADRILRFQSSILEQPVRSEAVDQALRGESGTQQSTTFRGTPILISYAPLQVVGLDWVITCSQESAEAFAPVNDFARNIGIATIGLIMLLTLSALLLAQVFTRPIHRLTAAARAVASGDLAASVSLSSRDELDELGEAFNELTQSLRGQATLLEERDREIDRLLGNLMPGAIAQRYKQGDQEIAEQHQNVTVLYAHVHGFVAYSSRLSAQQAATALNRLIGAFDEAAERHGVEKFKTIGASYLAVCGLTVPRILNDTRVVDLALEMQQIVARYNRERGAALRLCAGIASGAVTAAIIGRQRFVYDMWGDTISMAARVAEFEHGDAILATTELAERLRGVYTFEPVGELARRQQGPQQVWAIKTEKDG